MLTCIFSSRDGDVPKAACRWHGELAGLALTWDNSSLHAQNVRTYNTWPIEESQDFPRLILRQLAGHV